MQALSGVNDVTHLSVILNLQQDSGNGKLGLGEFATLWKKVQRYLVRCDL